jgi:genome maintenance exonuclease 1
MRSPAEKARLASWRKNKGSQANLACQIGRLGHRQIENYFNNGDKSCPVILQRHWEQALPVLNKIHNIRLLESPIFHYYQGYAGRVDCVGKFDNLPYEMVFEFKFSALPRIYDEQKLQIAAYIGGLNRHYRYPHNVQIHHGMLITITPNEVDLTFLDSPEVDQYWEKWKQEVSHFWSQYPNIA